MCQGVIVSLVKFRVKNRTKQVVLAGIGSHSQLVAENQKRLKRLGFRENSKGQSVISIESDFSGWNKFNVESGIPTKEELKVLASIYKKIAGNASALIRHVKRCGKIDDALIGLLMAPAQKLYNETTAQAWCKLFAVKSNRILKLQ